jgi:hypothetical protein
VDDYSGKRLPSQEDGYVGSGTCISCHSNIHSELVAGWQGSAHHQTMQPVSENPGIVDSLLKDYSVK